MNFVQISTNVKDKIFESMCKQMDAEIFSACLITVTEYHSIHCCSRI